MRQIETYLMIMGQGLVVEGVTVQPHGATLSGFCSASWGHLVVDDFHHLDNSRKRQIADLIKSLADKDRRDAKLTIIGINPVGDSLVADFPDLVGRFVTVSVATQPREKLDELIRKGETAANVEFLRRGEFIEAAAGGVRSHREGPAVEVLSRADGLG